VVCDFNFGSVTSSTNVNSTCRHDLFCSSDQCLIMLPPSSMRRCLLRPPPSAHTAASSIHRASQINLCTASRSCVCPRLCLWGVGFWPILGPISSLCCMVWIPTPIVGILTLCWLSFWVFVGPIYGFRGMIWNLGVQAITISGYCL